MLRHQGQGGNHPRRPLPEEAPDDPERIAIREALAFGKALYDIRTELGLTFAMASVTGSSTRKQDVQHP